MIPEPYEPFDIGNSSDKIFMLGTSGIVIFLLLA
jgi:hypothetical protein